MQEIQKFSLGPEDQALLLIHFFFASPGRRQRRTETWTRHVLWKPEKFQWTEGKCWWQKVRKLQFTISFCNGRTNCVLNTPRYKFKIFQGFSKISNFIKLSLRLCRIYYGNRHWHRLDDSYGPIENSKPSFEYLSMHILVEDS